VYKNGANFWAILYTSHPIAVIGDIVLISE